MKMYDVNASPLQNHLLKALPHEVYERWLPELERVGMPLGKVLYESGTPQDYLYFPTTAVVSMLFQMANGESAEIAIVGNDGLVGIALFLGGDSMSSRALIQNAGAGYRVPAAFAKKEFEECKPVMHMLMSFTQALIAQMTQSAACYKHHSLDQQLCRWLLMTLDRHKGMELRMTRQMIANMLGVNGTVMRAGAQRLQDEGLLNYVDGQITVLDRPGVERRSCECYALVEKEYDRIFHASGS